VAQGYNSMQSCPIVAALQQTACCHMITGHDAYCMNGSLFNQQHLSGADVTHKHMVVTISGRLNVACIPAQSVWPTHPSNARENKVDRLGHNLPRRANVHSYAVCHACHSVLL